MEGHQQQQRQHLPALSESMLLNIGKRAHCNKALLRRRCTGGLKTIADDYPHGSASFVGLKCSQTLSCKKISRPVHSLLLWDEVTKTHPAFHMSCPPHPPPTPSPPPPSLCRTIQKALKRGRRWLHDFSLTPQGLELEL